MPDQRALERHSENCSTDRWMMNVQYYARQKSLLEGKVGSKSLKNAKKSYEQYDPHFLISVPLKSPLLTKMKDETGDETPHLISPTKYTKIFWLAVQTLHMGQPRVTSSSHYWSRIIWVVGCRVGILIFLHLPRPAYF